MNALNWVNSAVPEAFKTPFRRLAPESAWTYVRAHSKPLQLYQTDRFNFYPVSREPPVIYTTSGDTLGNIFYMARALDGNPGRFIVAFHRHISSWKAHFLKRQVAEFERRHKKCKLTILAPEKEERRRVSEITGADVRYINKNAFTREDQFQIQAGVDKVYDAIMNARMLKFKRVELARLVDDLAMITAGINNEDYFEEVRTILDGAVWLNFQNGE